MTSPRPALVALLVALALPLGAVSAPHANAKSRSVHAPAGVALSGFDPVAYFKQGAAVRGDEGHVLRWRGALWRFSSSANLAAFEADPMAYFPQFGGFCVMALAEGRAVPGDPEVWMIHEGRLYLSSSVAAQNQWQSNPSEILGQAAAHWPDAAR